LSLLIRKTCRRALSAAILLPFLLFETTAPSENSVAKKKTKPPTAIAYAARLYMAGDCNGAVSTMTDHDIVNCRIRAFVDGVNWAKRQARKKQRS
jgi:hypothetical protein